MKNKAMEYLTGAIASRMVQEFGTSAASAAELESLAERSILGELGWLEVLGRCKGGDVAREDIVGFLSAYGIGDDPVAVGAMVILLHK